MYDLIIRNGTIVDGTGAAQHVGDIAITDGVLVQVGGTVRGEAREVIDATDLVVTPGFVDVHTHFDGQATFDDVLDPSASHGVTTVVLGSCGLGFAPARAEDHDRLVETMECVEDIPGDVLRAGLPWQWETFPDYLDFLETRNYSMDVATQIGHIAVRTYVMGERGIKNEEATNADIDEMGRIVREGIDAGALGFSTSRVLAHTTSDGSQVPGTFAGEDELFGIAAAMSGGSYAVFQLAQSGADGQDAEAAIKELDWMRRLSAQFGLPVSFLQLQSMQAPDLWKELLDAAWEARADGANITAQVANRPFGMLLGLTNRHPFTARATYVAAKERTGSLDELLAELAKPEVKAAILAEEDTVDTGGVYDTMGKLPVTLAFMCFPLEDDLDYEPTADKSVAARAEAAGVSPEEYVYDTMLDAGGKRMFVLPFFNYAQGNHDATYAMLTHPASVPGLGDGGAHLATICDASMPTYQLSHWVKGRTRGPRLSLEAAVKMQTHDTAALYGLGDRGTLEAGKKADLNVIDLDALKLLQPRVEHDLPAGGARLLQSAEGYRYTIVGGVVTRQDDTDTGARPGRLVRGAR